MGSSSGGTQTTEPPKWQRPYIQRGLEEAENQYQRDVQQFSPYQGYTDMALHGIVDQARNNPLAGNAASLANQTLTGGFLGSNPYLNQTFEQARLATQNGLASEFAGAGRNINASQGLRSQQLNDLATQIYGGAYDAERNRQQQVLGMTPMLQQAQYGDLDRLMAVGQSGSSALDQYLGRVNGPMGSSTKTTGGGNSWGTALGGAMMGLGTLFGSGGLGALAFLSDERTKTDINKVGEANGLNVYEYRYKQDPEGQRHTGYLAQEVEKMYPDSVVEDASGKKFVMYDRVAKHGFMGSLL